MKIRFSEHIDESYRQGILEEIAESFGGTTKQLADDEYRVSYIQPNRRTNLIDFLRQEEMQGTAVFDEVEEDPTR